MTKSKGFDSVAEPQKITAWSFSRYQTYTQCPLKAKFQFVDKLKTASSPALEKGLMFHKECEKYLKGEVKKLPAVLKPFAKELAKLRKDKAESEVEITYTAGWEETGWFSRDAWLRLKIDAIVRKPHRVSMLDFKTGKIKDDHQEQLSLYALGEFLRSPELEEVDAALWYFDYAKIVSHTFMKEELPKLKAEWQAKTEAMLNDTGFAPSPNYLCRFCDFSKNADGEHKGKCKF